MSQVMAAKVKELARLMMISRKTVAYTGAGGVSGHPGDYRGYSDHWWMRSSRGKEVEIEVDLCVMFN